MVHTHFTWAPLVYYHTTFTVEIVCSEDLISFQYYKCGGQYALVSVGCIAAYAAFTLGITQWR